MEYTRLTIKQQLTTVRQQILAYEDEHYTLSLQDSINGEPTIMGENNGEPFTSEDRRNKLETGIKFLNKEVSRLESLLPKTEPAEHTGIVEEHNAAP